jgi:hypothetical protein
MSSDFLSKDEALSEVALLSERIADLDRQRSAIMEKRDANMVRAMELGATWAETANAGSVTISTLKKARDRIASRGQ